jgi:hypothetical protein
MRSMVPPYEEIYSGAFAQLSPLLCIPDYCDSAKLDVRVSGVGIIASRNAIGLRSASYHINDWI